MVQEYGLKDEFNIYGKVNARVSGSLNAFADLQVRHINYRFTGPDSDLKDLTGTHSFTFFNPKTGLFWSNGSGSEAFVSAAMAHREPTRTDYKDAAGDPGATPRQERLTDIEGGYALQTSRAH